MASTQTPTAESRDAQRFPILTAAEIARARRFGETRTYPPGAPIARAGAQLGPIPRYV